MVERKNYPVLPLPVGPYVHATKHGNVLYLSGLTAYGSKAQGKSMPEQAAFIISQIAQIAELEGKDLRSLLKVTIFVTHLDEMEALRKALSQSYGNHPPASSLIQIEKLFSPEINIEIEAIIGL